jgi:hypothetical protein
MKVQSFRLEEEFCVSFWWNLCFDMLFTSPHQQSWIVSAKLQEILSVDGEQSASMCRTLIRLAVVISSLLFTFWNFVLLVQHSPLEDASIVVAIGVYWSILERFVVDSVNNRDGHHSRITVDWGKERWKPVLVDFAVSVEVDYDLA